MSEPIAAPAEAAHDDVAVAVDPIKEQADLLEQFQLAASAGDRTLAGEIETKLNDALEKARAAKEKPAEPEPEPEPQEEPPAEEAPETPTEEEPEAEEEEEPEAKPEEGEEPPTEAPKAKKEPDRFRFKDEEDRAVAQLARAKGISLVKAAEMYASLNPPASSKEPEPEPQPGTDVQALITRAKELEAILEEAGYTEGLFNPEIAKANIELSRVNAKIAASEVEARLNERTSQLTAKQMQAQWDAAQKDVVKAYPDFGNQDSALFLVAKGIAEKMQDPAHPDHGELFKPTAPKFLADKAAQKLKIAPAVAKAPAVPAKPAAAPAPTARPAKGSKGSAPATPAPTDQDLIAAQLERTMSTITGGGSPSRSVGFFIT